MVLFAANDHQYLFNCLHGIVNLLKIWRIGDIANPIILFVLFICVDASFDN